MNNIFEKLSCPVCLEIPENEIFQCKNGHNICGRCSTSIVHCPQCRVPYGEVKVRNRTVEDIVQSLKVDCPNKDNGCPERLLPDTVETHKNSCQYSANAVELCQLIGFNCGYKMNIKNVASGIQHLQTEHGAKTQTVSKFDIQLDEFPNSSIVSKDKTWSPYIIKLADTNIVLAAHLKNDILSCVGVMLEVSTVQESRRMMECQIKGLTDESIHVVWQSRILSPIEIVRRGAALPDPVRMDYIRHHAMSANGTLSINVSVSEVGAAGARRGHQSTGVIAKAMYDYMGDENKTLSMRTGDIVQVIEKGTDRWCLCELHGIVGYVPIPLIDFSIQQKPSTKELSLPETEVQARCLHPYDAWNEEEITLRNGDIVRVISKDIYHGWWKCEFNGKTGLVPENKLTLVSNVDSSEPAEKHTIINTNQFRWVQCKEGEAGTIENSVRSGFLCAVRAEIPGLTFKAIGCLSKGETTAVICFKHFVFRVSEYEILCIPEGYWKLSPFKKWGKLSPEGSISAGIFPYGTKTYLGSHGGFASINAREGYCYKVKGNPDSVTRETEYHFILAVKT